MKNYTIKVGNTDFVFCTALVEFGGITIYQANINGDFGFGLTEAESLLDLLRAMRTKIR